MTTAADLTPVTSKMLHAVGFTGTHIAVQFKPNGPVYHYPADQATYDAFSSAESKGAHFAKHIRPIGHSHKVEK